MPNSAVHDAVTFLLTAPTFTLSYAITGDIAASAVVAAGLLFGGLMFGPDLDTLSKQYSRWGPFRLLWYPYRSVFNHRSRWSHGLTFGSLLRVVYFFGALTLIGLLVFAAVSIVTDTDLLGLGSVETVWRRSGSLFRDHLGARIAVAAFAGCWFGAASHTLTDIAVSYVKTGRVSEFL